jgi:hypothetical protein
VSCLSFWKGVVRGELHFLHAHPIKNIEEEIQEGVTTPTFFRSIFCRWTNTFGNYDFDVKKVNDAKIKMIMVMKSSKQEKKYFDVKQVGAVTGLLEIRSTRHNTRNPEMRG